MMFRPELAIAVMVGEKTVTRRLANDKPLSPWNRAGCGYGVGQSVAIQPGRGTLAIGRAEVTSVERVPLGYLSIDEAVAEGFPNPLAFEEAWAAINGSYDPDVEVWRIGLRAITSEAVDRG